MNFDEPDKMGVDFTLTTGRLKAELEDAQCHGDWRAGEIESLRKQLEAAERNYQEVVEIGAKLLADSVNLEKVAKTAEAELELHKQIYTHSANDIEIVNAQLRGSWLANETLKQRAEKAEACANAAAGEIANLRFVTDKRGDEVERLRAELAKTEANALACLDSANAHHRKKMDELTEYVKERNALHSALESIAKLMVSMQSLGYFTNDEWQSRLVAAHVALKKCPECQLELDTNGEIAWCDNGHVWTLDSDAKAQARPPAED